MPPDNLYIIPDDDDEDKWVQPRSVETIVADSVREATGVTEDELLPLADYVDEAALTELFDESSNRAAVSFRVEDHDVTVNQSGDVTIED